MDLKSLLEEIVRLYEQNLKLFNMMLEVTEQIGSYELYENIDKYQRLLDERQNLINQIVIKNNLINEIESQISKNLGLKEYNVEYIDQYVSSNTLEKIKSILNEEKNIIMKIIELDQYYRDSIEQSKTFLLVELSFLQGKKLIQKIYGTTPIEKARLIDKLK